MAEPKTGPRVAYRQGQNCDGTQCELCVLLPSFPHGCQHWVQMLVCEPQRVHVSRRPGSDETASEPQWVNGSIFIRTGSLQQQYDTGEPDGRLWCDRHEIYMCPGGTLVVEPVRNAFLQCKLVLYIIFISERSVSIPVDELVTSRPRNLLLAW